MKNNNLKNYFVAFLFLVNFAAFAETFDDSSSQDLDDPSALNGYTGNASLEGQVEAPINTYVLGLGVAGVLLGAFYFSSKTKKA